MGIRRAIIIAAGQILNESPIRDRYPFPMLPLVDRPFLFHCIEMVVRLGIKDLDIILCLSPDKIESCAGEGERWGCSITYHLVRDPETPYYALKRLSFAENERFLLIHADSLPNLDLFDHRQWNEPDQSVFFMADPCVSEVQDPSRWTGWAILSSLDLAFLNEIKQDAFFDYLISNSAKPVFIDIPECLHVSNLSWISCRAQKSFK